MSASRQHQVGALDRVVDVDGHIGGTKANTVLKMAEVETPAARRHPDATRAPGPTPAPARTDGAAPDECVSTWRQVRARHRRRAPSRRDAVAAVAAKMSRRVRGSAALSPRR